MIAKEWPYLIKCPNCNGYMTLRNHTVTVNAQGLITADPSVVCPHNCGWHVRISDGIATGWGA